MNKFKALMFFLITIVITILSLPSYAQPSIGGYSDSDETAIISFRPFYLGQKHLKEKELLWIDFKNKKTHIIDQGIDTNWRRVNRNGTRVAYLKGSSPINIYDLNKMEIIRVLNNGIDSVHFYWTENPDVLAGINKKSSSWFALNLQEDVYQEAKYGGQKLWGVAWSSNCACVEFEVSDEVYTDHYLIRLDKAEIKKVEGRQYLSQSPDGRYTVFGKESAGDDGPNEFILLDNKKNTKIKYYARSPIEHEQILWGNGVVRIITDIALLNLETGDTIDSIPSIWKGRRPKGRGRIPIDLAADPAGYVLRWDMDKKQFLVEDINAGGKIIKTYEKFWGNDASSAKEDASIKKP